MIISCFETKPWQQEQLEQQLSGHTLLFFEKPIQDVPLEQYSNSQALVVFIYSKVSGHIITSLPNLQLIATRSTGFDHIDLEACKKNNITLTTVPTYGENTVAEHTFALLLSISRRIPESFERVQKGSFDSDGLRGFDLKGKTLGVIGAGSIGKHVIRIANGFEMNVVAHDPFPKEGLDKKLGFSWASLDELLKQSDIVTLHCPYNESTHHLLNRETLAHIKPGAVLINTARGGLIDSDALLQALQDGRIKFVGIDVLEEEAAIHEEIEVLTDMYKQRVDLHRVLANHILLRHPRVYITPHNAFNSEEALMRILHTTIENIRRFSEGQPINTVSLS